MALPCLAVRSCEIIAPLLVAPYALANARLDLNGIKA